MWNDQNVIVGHLHQQTSFPAGTVTDDDEFAADFSHLNRKGSVSESKFDGEASCPKNGIDSTGGCKVREIARRCVEEERRLRVAS